MKLIKVSKLFDIYLSKENEKDNPKIIDKDNKKFFRFMDQFYIPDPVYKLSTPYVKELNTLREKYLSTIDKEYNNYIINNSIDYLLKSNLKIQNILDFGCGNGYAGSLIKNSFKDISLYGYDIRKPIKKKFLNHYSEVKFKDINSSLPYPDNFFDVILSFFVFQFFIPDNQLEELKRLIKPNGILYFNLIKSADFTILKRIEDIGFTILNKEELVTINNTGCGYAYKLKIIK